MSARRLLLYELLALGVAIGVAWLLGWYATGAWLDRVATLDGARPARAAVVAAARRADLYFSAGVLVLAVARVLVHRRARDPLPAPWLFPAAVYATLIGLAVHLGTVETGPAGIAAPSADGFALGFLIGAIAAAAILLVPLDLAALAARWRIVLAVAIAGIFAALAVAGTGPGESGTRINLGPLQPIEAVKPLAVLFLAGFLGRRAAKLRWQRRRILGLRWPRLGLLVPGLLVLVGIVAGLFVVGDLGPVLLLAVVFIAMFYVVTRATGWALAALALLVAMLALAAAFPALVDTGRVATRIHIWKDPWNNGLPHGHQVGEGLWAFAAGGPWGQGLAHAATPLPPAGKTDLVLAPLVEQLGAATLLVYLALLGTIALAGLAIAARARTSERVLIGAGASLLLIAQWALIHGGTLGVLPLTGIVVPFVSSGKSSMVAFLVLVALLARLAHDGPPRAPSDELVELHRAARGLRIAVVSMLLLGAVLTVRAAAVGRDATTARTIRVRLRDGTVVQRANPRLLAVARAIRRGAITDRDGAPLAISSATARDYPLGDAMGTLLGVDPSPVQRPPWALEGLLDDHLRGYRTLGDLAPLVTRSPADRAAALRALDAAVADRSVALSIDAALQQKLAALAAAQKGLAVAAVVIDVDTGQVLARVQRPDFDPPEVALATHGAYGSWPDKTGLQGMFQAGSVGKLFTALAAVRAGMPWHGTGCAARSDVRFACVDHDDQGPMFTRPGWPKPIHDHARDDNHGELELVGALAVSCNVYFGQLGLDLGGEPFAALRLAGADVGYPGGAYAPGPAGSRQLASTAFGQGATVMNVMQAARLVAAIAAGGHYRRCPPTMELAAPCPDTPLLEDPAALAPILAGMALVMTDGTGKHLAPPKGVRVYGKTGTADVRGFAGEEPFGIARRATASPHSWFVAFAEPDSTPACALTAPRRLAIAVVVPRGGAGATAAGPLAMKILAAAQELGYL